MVTLHTNFGDIKIALNATKAPLTVKNFIDNVESGHYDNTIFHRVINNFMIQGGGFTSGMTEKEAPKTIRNEASNGLSNFKYSVAMARTNQPHSASAQFFINTSDNKYLDFISETDDGWGYCVFGEVVEGKEFIDKMNQVQTSNYGYVHQDVPIDDIILTHITLSKKSS